MSRWLGSIARSPYNRGTLFVEPVMPNLRLADLTAEIEANVRRALLEDIGSGDITAQLIPAERLAKATIITRDAAVISGTAWVDAVFRQLDPRVTVECRRRPPRRAGGRGGDCRRRHDGSDFRTVRSGSGQEPVMSVQAFVQASKSVQMSPRPSRQVLVGVFQYQTSLK